MRTGNQNTSTPSEGYSQRYSLHCILSSVPLRKCRSYPDDELGQDRGIIHVDVAIAVDIGSGALLGRAWDIAGDNLGAQPDINQVDDCVPIHITQPIWEDRTVLEGANVTGFVSNETTLIRGNGVPSDIVAASRIDRRAAEEQGMSLGRSAVVLQRAEQGIDWISRRPHLIAGGWGEKATVVVADHIVAARGERSTEVRGPVTGRVPSNNAVLDKDSAFEGGVDTAAAVSAGIASDGAAHHSQAAADTIPDASARLLLSCVPTDGAIDKHCGT